MAAHIPLNPERDEAIRKLASKFSEVAGGQLLDISVAAAALFIVAQTDNAQNPDFEKYVVTKIKQVVALYEPTSERGEKVDDLDFLG